MIRVALVDDHGLVRAGLKALVADQPGFQVVAEGTDGRDVERIAEQVRPDILLLDIGMKDMSGLDALAQLRRSHPQMQVLMLSMHDSADQVLLALRLGAHGYLLKQAAAEELGLALQALSRRESYLSPGISQLVIQQAVQGQTADQPVVADRLTPRQREILRLLARGCSAREMANGLGLSVKTIEAHRAQIMERLDVRDVPSLVRYAIRQGLVTLDE